jgi:phenylalanyl-tRNA synthetase beta chain
MIISVNWIKKFTEIDGSIDELAMLIGARLVEIEDIADLGKKYDGVIVARVVECEKLESSDHLNVTKIDDGGVAKDIERDENGLVQVVCGAPNVRAGLLVAWLPPNSTVPETFGDKEPFVLGARKLRGVMSNGMLASAKELDLFDDHTGILEIDKDVKPGTQFAIAYELDDYLLDIENKSLTHRPDTFGLVGFAREVAAIQGKAFVTPEKLRNENIQWIEKTGDEQLPTVTIDDPKLSDRYQAVVLSGVDATTQSSLEVQTYLARIGVRPISAVVDATNYLMMLTGQPLHAFDYDKLKAVNNGTIDMHVRAAHEGEKLKLLDGREIALSQDDIVIANGGTVVSLAGAMGGEATEVDANTTNVLLESATFNLYNLRNTQMRHGIFSEAMTRDTKGQPAELTAPVLAEAVNLLNISTGATRVSDVADAYPGYNQAQPVVVTLEAINETLGGTFNVSDALETLQNAEFTVTLNDEKTELAVTAPYWRADIHIPEDIIEEVGRLNGFDSIEPTLPARDFTAVSPDSFDKLRAEIRQAFSRAGANEVLTYSFVHGDLLQKAGQKPADSYRIVNSLSPDLQYYRQTLTPSLLNLVHSNIKNGFDSFVLYELNKAHSKRTGVNDENVPNEYDYLALTTASKKPQPGAPYYTAKKYLDYLAELLQLQFVYTPIEEDPGYAESAPFEYRRSSMVSDLVSGEYIGIVGEYKKSVAKAFKLPEYAAGSELDPRALLRAQEKNILNYQPLSRYPGSERDICFQVEESVNYGQIITIAKQVLEESELETSIAPLDIYQPKDEAFKNITIRIRLVSHQKTLNSDDVNLVINDVIAKVVSATNARVV